MIAIAAFLYAMGLLAFEYVMFYLMAEKQMSARVAWVVVGLFWPVTVALLAACTVAFALSDRLDRRERCRKTT